MTRSQTARRTETVANRPDRGRPTLRDTWPLSWTDAAALLVAFAAFVGLGWVIGTVIVSLSDTPFGRFDAAVSDLF